jgi:hypothetical protein
LFQGNSVSLVGSNEVIVLFLVMFVVRLFQGKSVLIVLFCLDGDGEGSNSNQGGDGGMDPISAEGDVGGGDRASPTASPLPGADPWIAVDEAVGNATHSAGRYRCPKCRRSLSSETALRRHYATVHVPVIREHQREDGLWPCASCGTDNQHQINHQQQTQQESKAKPLMSGLVGGHVFLHL